MYGTQLDSAGVVAPLAPSWLVRLRLLILNPTSPRTLCWGQSTQGLSSGASGSRS